MNFSQFFITRPIFAAVISIVITLVGAIAAFTLPIAQYPEITPPTVEVKAVYPGANAETVSETVAAVIEKEVNGVQDMIYMQSQSANDGSMTLNVTFEVGTDLDTAQVLVQNRVAIAEAKLPEEVKRQGVTVKKKSPDIMLMINLVSPDGRYDPKYLDNYMLLQVKDVIARIPGVGDANPFGSEYSIRIWLDPARLSSRGLTADDVINAVREQNVQVAAGSVGQEPAPDGTELQLSLTMKGRLTSTEEFAAIILKGGDEGELVRIRDVGRVELGAKDYNISTKVDGVPAATLAVYQAPGSNAISTAQAIYSELENLKKSFPDGLEYRVVYDTTGFVQESVHVVIHTLFEAAVLVIIVVLVFLQNWRSTLIPMIAVPVSIIGTFAVMKMIGFTLNNLSLFGLVLAIGIVVDDAIVVVEAVELKMAGGMAPLEATRAAMGEVSGALIAIAVVLSAVFVPTAFIPGLSGLFYKQFALTIATSTVISAFNSLTLSPALCALLLKPHGAKKDPLEFTLNLALGWFFKLFNKTFEVGTRAYGGLVRSLCRVSIIVLAVYGGLLFLTYTGFSKVPVGFIPNQDKGYLMVMVQLDEGASQQRTKRITERVEEFIKDVDGIGHYLVMNGYSILNSSASSNSATVFVILDEFAERETPELKAEAILKKLMGEFRNYPEAVLAVFGPPPISGMGSTGGLKLFVQDRSGLGFPTLEESTREMMRGVMEQPGVAGASTTFRSNNPKLFVEVDREKAKSMGVPLNNVYGALQTYLGSSYINDLTLFGRTFQVKAQSESSNRTTRADVFKLKTRNSRGEEVPLGGIVRVKDTTGPAVVTRFNMYPSADFIVVPTPQAGSGTIISTAEAVAAHSLPAGYTVSWTEIAFQQIRAGNVALLVFPLCVLFVFLVLAAQYESWLLPMAIVMIVPMCLFASIWGLYGSNMQNDIFAQIGFVVLVGLACKNAILIVEFAKQIQETSDKSRLDAAVEAAKLRLRPILMTSAAFTLGVVPLMLSKGAGAEMRISLGTAVFYGMLGVTGFGILLTPVFYTVVMKFAKQRVETPPAEAASGTVASAPSAGGH